MASILVVEEYTELLASLNIEAINQFVETGSVFDGVPPIDEIFKITDNYINAKKLQQ
jgi:hypothetical protein